MSRKATSKSCIAAHAYYCHKREIKLLQGYHRRRRRPDADRTGSDPHRCRVLRPEGRRHTTRIFNDWFNGFYPSESPRWASPRILGGASESHRPRSQLRHGRRAGPDLSVSAVVAGRRRAGGAGGMAVHLRAIAPSTPNGLGRAHVATATAGSLPRSREEG